MANPIVEQLFRQNRWANLTLIDALEPLGDRTKEMTVEGVQGSAYDTIVHVIASETSYLARIREAGEPIPWTRGEQPGWDRLRDVAHQAGEAFIRVARALEGDPVQTGEYRGEPFTMPTSLLLIQAYNHGVDHRSQIKTILTRYGVEPPELDAWWWHDSEVSPQRP